MVRDLCKINSDLFFSLQKRGGREVQEKIVIFNTQKKSTIFEYNRFKTVHKILLFFIYLKTRGEGGR